MSEQSLSRVEIGRKRRQRDRAIVRGIFATITARVFTAAASLLTLAIASRVLTRNEFGFLASVVALWMILTMLDLGLGGALTTRIATAFARDDADAMSRHSRDTLQALTALGVFLAVAGSATTLILPWARWLGSGVPPSSVTPAVVLMFVTAGASMPGVVGIAILTGTQRMATAQLSSALGACLTVLLAIGAGALQLPPWAFVASILGCPTVVNIGVTGWIVLRLPAPHPHGKSSRSRIADTARASVYFALLNASSAVALGTGTLVVAIVLGSGQAASFSVASRMYAMVFAVVSTSGAQLWPSLAEAIARRDLRWARQRYWHSIVTVTAVTAFAGVVLVALGRPVARVWVGASLEPSLSVLLALGALTVAVCGAAQASTLQLATERVRPLAVLCCVNAVLGTAASFALTEAVGPAGAAVGTLASCVCVLIPGIVALSRTTLQRLPAA